MSLRIRLAALEEAVEAEARCPECESGKIVLLPILDFAYDGAATPKPLPPKTHCGTCGRKFQVLQLNPITFDGGRELGGDDE